jgi:type IX secretion system PorP/SprF family membrane protein
LKYFKINRMKKLFTSAILALLAFTGVAQQDAMFTHYAFNTMSVNPAYAGNRGVMTTTLLHRSQWVGFDGAPMTQTLTLNAPIFGEHMGIGVSLRNDNIGPENAFTGNLDLAYRLKINEKNKLAFGIKGGVTLYNRSITGLAAAESGDYAIDNASTSDYLFDVGFGLLYTNDKFYLGASVPRVLEQNMTNRNDASDALGAREFQHFYFTAGTAIRLSKQVELKPSTFVKTTIGTPMEVDLTAMFVMNKKLELGGMWRSNDAIGILVGYTFKENFRVGYSFDWSYGNKTFTYNYGSHEVMLRYDLFYKGNKDIISPRYF